MDFDLPSKDSVFEAVHPFSEPDFTFKREMNAKTALRALFDGHHASLSCQAISMFDTFVLIHSRSSKAFSKDVSAPIANEASSAIPVLE